MIITCECYIESRIFPSKAFVCDEKQIIHCNAVILLCFTIALIHFYICHVSTCLLMLYFYTFIQSLVRDDTVRSCSFHFDQPQASAY